MEDFYTELPCPICGNREYSLGNFGPKHFTYFDREVAFVKMAFSVGEKIVARHCDTCGNIQLSTSKNINQNMMQR